MDKAKLILIRGLPGSGKSTLAQEYVAKGWRHFEADMYHLDDEGNYVYNVANIKKAHEWCFKSAINALNRGINVVVSNTFVRLWEMQHYIDAWPNYAVIECTDNYGSIHNVPMETLVRMKSNWEPWDYSEI